MKTKSKDFFERLIEISQKIKLILWRKFNIIFSDFQEDVN